MESSRRASGKSLVDDLRAIQSTNTRERRLSQLDASGGVAAKRGRADYTAKEVAKGGGIDSPLTELEANGREYYPDHYSLYSNDTLLSVEIRPLKSLKMKDASGADVELNFQKPPQVVS